MASHLLAAAIRIHHLNPVTAPPLRFVESPWGKARRALRAASAISVGRAAQSARSISQMLMNGDCAL